MEGKVTLDQGEEKVTLDQFRHKKAKEKFNKKLVPIEGKCIYKLPLKPRLCYQLVNPKLSLKYCRFHL